MYVSWFLYSTDAYWQKKYWKKAHHRTNFEAYQKLQTFLGGPKQQ